MKFDEKIETPGGTFYIDGASVLYLIGSTMDWVEDDFAAGFVFENPNAKGALRLRRELHGLDRERAFPRKIWWDSRFRELCHDARFLSGCMP